MERANVKKHEEIVFIYMVWYRIYGSRENLGKKGRRLRSNRYKEESFPRTKSIPPPPPK